MSRRARTCPSRRSPRTPRRRPRRRAPTPSQPARQPGPPTPGSEKEESPDPELEPDGGRSGLHGMVGPDLDADVDDILDPPRRRARRRLQHTRRQAQGHRRLELQQGVENPQQSESDPKHPTGDGLGPDPDQVLLGWRSSRPRPNGGIGWSGGCSRPPKGTPEPDRSGASGGGARCGTSTRRRGSSSEGTFPSPALRAPHARRHRRGFLALLRIIAEAGAEPPLGSPRFSDGQRGNQLRRAVAVSHCGTARRSPCSEAQTVLRFRRCRPVRCRDMRAGGASHGEAVHLMRSSLASFLPTPSPSMAMVSVPVC